MYATPWYAHDLQKMREVRTELLNLMGSLAGAHFAVNRQHRVDRALEKVDRHDRQALVVPLAGHQRFKKPAPRQFAKNDVALAVADHQTRLVRRHVQARHRSVLGT